ncbi:hypothetical protein B0A48_08990 [Cryoendolithus antarcticus]|uniref:AHC1-like C2H2 zinc-finger domain-containing protein n=1 Tax=Cryoendolithus antarcticus TaxID=1507870 RepID=A0A1V8T1C6_9PEZI|nr:hypothetical protein B0A48_08990 [Cryoendolithus antarcticus]
MQSTFRLAWANEQPTGKAAAPAVVPAANKVNKRKRASSPAASSLFDPAKKSRSGHISAQTLPLDLANISKDTVYPASLAYATPGATPTTAFNRSEYLAGALSPHHLDLNRTDSVFGESHREHTPSNLPDSKPNMQVSDHEMLDVSTASTVEIESRTPLQQMLENQLNMQILLKHNELRLIEQEEAKCKIALDQLRRCELRPFPGTLRPSEDVYTGTGSAIDAGTASSQATFAPAYGVTDGPYSRHYAQWLLKDPAFDAERVSFYAAPVETPEHVASRSGRPIGSGRKTASKAIAAPIQTGAFPPSLPNYPPPPTRREKSGPLILRRSTDGRLVKLVCNDCNRGDMNSIQGFLNHCRIAHKVDYKSHDQAAVSCGRPMDDDEIASLPAETQATPVSKPTTRAARIATAPMQPLPHGAVHPYNIQGNSLPRTKPQAAARRPPTKPAALLARPGLSNVSQSTPLNPSSRAPHLSALLAKNNVGVNLDLAIINARQPIDASHDDDHLLSPRDSGPMSPDETPAPSRGKSLPLTHPGVPRPSSRKGYRPPAQHQASTLALDAQHERLHASSLSPHTVDDPGLISDREDEDEHGSASEEEGHAPVPRGAGLLPVTARACTDAMDLDVEVDEDAIGEHEGRVRVGGKGRKLG